MRRGGQAKNCKSGNLLSVRVRQASEESGSDKERERSALRADLYLCEKKAGSGYMVSFIGAGPGDPELLTIKGKKLIDSADIIIYAGSLVNPQVLSDAKEGAVITTAPV